METFFSLRRRRAAKATCTRSCCDTALWRMGPTSSSARAVRSRSGASTPPSQGRRIGTSACESRLAGNSPLFPATRFSIGSRSAPCPRMHRHPRRPCCASAIEPSRPAPNCSRSAMRVLANVKQYIAFLYLTRAPGLKAWKKAGQKLAECIRLHPRTLLTRKTWHLLFAWSLLQLYRYGWRRSDGDYPPQDVRSMVDDLAPRGLAAGRGPQDERPGERPGQWAEIAA